MGRERHTTMLFMTFGAWATIPAALKPTMAPPTTRARTGADPSGQEVGVPSVPPSQRFGVPAQGELNWKGLSDTNQPESFGMDRCPNLPGVNPGGEVPEGDLALLHGLPSFLDGGEVPPPT